MKYFLILISLIIVACCTSKSESKSYVKNGIEAYKVYKIDSINTYYLIYAKRNDSLYKIVSKKEMIASGNKICLNDNYAFKLHSTLSEFRIGNVTISPKSSNVNCFAFDKETNICLEGDSIRDLYQADNIKGLYFIR